MQALAGFGLGGGRARRGSCSAAFALAALIFIQETPMPDLQTLGIHHITMVTTDAVRAVGFYRDLLGLGLVKRTVNFDDPGAYHLYFGRDGGAPGTLLTFFEWPGSPRGRWGVGGVHHLALSVDTPEAQLKWKRRLTDAGIPVTGPLDRGYFTSIYFGDPDGQVLEIATNGPGYAIDEPADALGQKLIQPDAGRLPEGRDEAAIAARTWSEPVPAVTPDMNLTGIHHITGITRDLSRMHDFFQEALGMPLVKRTLNQDDARTEHWFWARYDGATVAPRSAYTLFGWPSSNYVARPGAGQTHHVAFRARDEEEQLAWRDHLRSLDLDVTTVQDRQYFRSIYFRAPDGMLFEIATDGPGFTIDEPADALGRELRLPPWLEERRDRIADALTPIPSEPLG
jgi:glyoxalase family protein